MGIVRGKRLLRIEGETSSRREIFDEIIRIHGEVMSEVS